ncbi:MAG: acylneuraminate cytidylyltransferase family protein [Pyrinomonadaceae bacterium]|nr:acylneuraminate cytidylyltransferase family protein [Pyrinomonadaceae bacterium]
MSRKNIKLLCRRPLLQYTAEAALASKRLSRVILTTEDEEIAAVGRDCGLEVPFLRPSELACDDTPTLPVLQHAVRWIEDQGDRYDFICLLQPTNPLRRTEDIDACLAMLSSEDLDSVVSVLPVPHEHNPHWVYLLDDEGLMRLSTGETTPIPRRQALPPAFHREGSIYATRRNVLMEGDSLFGKRLGGYLMPNDHSVNIDTEEDWKRAEGILSNFRIMERASA